MKDCRTDWVVKMRIDKWLWAARFHKTRSLATQAIEAGRVRLNGERCKPSREVRAGDEIILQANGLEWQIRVKGFSDKRGSAILARELYEESESSRIKREEMLAMRRMSSEPAREIKGRPTKRERRVLTRLKTGE
jgi:ribosome-associated heat shock protein Hsp15